MGKPALHQTQQKLARTEKELLTTRAALTRQREQNRTLTDQREYAKRQVKDSREAAWNANDRAEAAESRVQDLEIELVEEKSRREDAEEVVDYHHAEREHWRDKYNSMKKAFDNISRALYASNYSRSLLIDAAKEINNGAHPPGTLVHRTNIKKIEKAESAKPPT